MFFAFLPIELANAAPRYGLWVEVEGKNQPFRSKKDFETFLELTAQYPFTDLYVQVYRGGRSWFRSKHADETPFLQAQAEGFDPLRDTIAAARRRGQRVHAWLNVLRVDRNYSAPILLRVGPKAVLVDNYGNSLLDYTEDGFPPGNLRSVFRLDTPGIWLDPSVTEVRAFNAKLVEDLLKDYPGLSGVHLDMIRFPFAMQHGGARSGPLLDFPFGDEAKRVLQAETGHAHPNKKGDKPIPSDVFRDWRRAQLSSLVFDIHSAIRRSGKPVELSTAVISWADRSENRVFQDWKTWLERKIVDYVLPINYTDDQKVADENSRTALRGTDSKRVLMGLGAWLHVNRPNALIRQGESTLRHGAGGVVLFSYSNLLSPQGRELLRQFSEILFRPSQKVHQDKVS